MSVVSLSFALKPEDVVLSLFLACTGAYAMLECCTIARRKMSEKLRVRWLGVASLCFGYSAIFTMHFVGMAAIEVTLPNGSVTELGFSLPVILFSIPCVGAGAFLGLYNLRHDDLESMKRKKLKVLFSGASAAVGVGIMHVRTCTLASI